MPSTVSTSIVRGARRRIATRAPKPSAKRYATGPEVPGPSKPAATTTDTASVIASASSPSTTRGSTPVLPRASSDPGEPGYPGRSRAGMPPAYGAAHPEASAAGLGVVSPPGDTAGRGPATATDDRGPMRRPVPPRHRRRHEPSRPRLPRPAPSRDRPPLVAHGPRPRLDGPAVAAHRPHRDRRRRR